MSANVNPRRASVQPDGPSVVRLLAVAGMPMAVYLLGSFAGVPSRTHPLVLLVVVPAAWFLGVLSARLGVGLSDRPRRARHTDAAGRLFVIGLAGSGLLLSQVLPVTAMEWLLLGAGGLVVGAAGQKWARERRAKLEAIGRE